MVMLAEFLSRGGVPRQHFICYTRLCSGAAVKSAIRTRLMALDGVITSPHRRTQTAFSSNSPRKNFTTGNELGSFSTVIRRHRFLLTTLALLAFLCTIYLYFAITLGAGDDLCSGLTGTLKALCHVQQFKQSVAKGKLKFI